jgi:ABC-type multidrug transport system ATPase subunit
VGPAREAAPSPAAELVGVVSVVDGFPLLTGVDLTVERGGVTLVSGPNGAGKTSLLLLLAGLVPVTRGRASVLGHDLAADRRSHRGRVALVGHHTGCYDDLGVRRNLLLHARAAGLGAGRVDEVIALLDLGDLASTPHGLLSTGQRRRCALALALARRADLLLLDEPHAGLDAAGRDVVDRAIEATAAGDATVVLVSHELDRARSLAAREVRLAGGAVIGTF